MKIYLDENRASDMWAGLLSYQGHDVIRPASLGLLGASDAVQLEQAIREKLVVITADNGDFSELHNLIQTAAGAHHGILLVRYDNDARRDMKEKHFAVAVGNVVKSGITLKNQLIVLNHWR